MIRGFTDSDKFIKFLKDEKFIEWKLWPTDETDTYWHEFLEQHPGEQRSIAMAEEHLRNVKLSSSFKLPKEKKDEAMIRLEQSLEKHNREKRIYRIVCSAAACVAAIIISLFYIQKNQDKEEVSEPVDYIVGSKLEIKDILLITGGKTSSFQENVDIRINKGNTAHIKDSNNDEQEIHVAENTMNQLVVPYGKQSKIVLSDGTRVWLNSGSTLTFPSTFTGDTRTVHLSGEVYIEVAPDRNIPFYVNMPDFKVKVYGTKFNVSSYPGTPPSVVLVEGRVGLQSPDRREVFLSPHEQAVLTENGFDTKPVNVYPFISWKNGYLMFDDTPITEVLKQIERYYNLSFDYDDHVNFRELTCTGKIILSENLDNVLTALTLITSTKYRMEDQMIYIYLK
jgi:ferric-dicitrate binding protein FerR (iron transport regulator)